MTESPPSAYLACCLNPRLRTSHTLSKVNMPMEFFTTEGEFQRNKSNFKAKNLLLILKKRKTGNSQHSIQYLCNAYNLYLVLMLL